MASIHFHTLGCRLNHAESERMARGFRMAGHTLVDDAASADIQVVNTCTVTRDAGVASRRAARPLHPGQRIVVTGCHSHLHPEEFAAADLVVDRGQKEELAALTLERFGMEGLSLGMENVHGAERLYPLALDSTRAFVKIQDGCDLACSFCLTTLARGKGRSRHAEDILAEIRTLREGGCREAVLTGVHAGSYGLDRGEDLGLLLHRILEETGIERLRMGSLEPWNFRDTWLPLWARFPGRLCRHLHMSLQSGCDSVLRRMRRCYDAATFAEKITEIRAAVPGIAITTDLIVGFPGETEAEHAESLAFVEGMSFAGAHIFAYSSRPGTAAATMPGHLAATVKKARHKAMSAVVACGEAAFRDSHIGQIHPVLWEQPESATRVTGLTDTFQRVATHPSLAGRNQILATRITGSADGLLVGEPVLAKTADAC